jgi:small GTP-binding protein
MIRVGLLGLPNVGKSSLFNLMTNSDAAKVGDYEFTTVATNRAVVRMLSDDVSKLAKAVGAKDVSYAELELWDIAGLVRGASSGRGLGNEFLGQLSDCDILVRVVRDTASKDVGSIPRQREIVDNEIALFDHKLLQKPYEKARHLSRQFPNDKKYTEPDEIISSIFHGTSRGAPIIDIASDEGVSFLDGLDIGLISLKPIATIVNTDSSGSYVQNDSGDVALNVKELLDLSTLSRDERIMLGFGADGPNSAAKKVVKLILSGLDLKQNFTVGHLGVGQWVSGVAASATEIAKQIHADFEQTCQEVDVARWKDFLELKDWNTVRKSGLVKTHKIGNYIPKDSEVLFFK